jgi:DDE superfamily endonuclease/homeodomain-containing protein
LPTIQPAPRARHAWHGGPPPTYQPRFSEAEIAQARSWACSQALPHAEVQRARLVLLLHEQPDMRSPQAARRLGQSAAWVCKWRRRWVEQGFRLQDAPRPGRPSQFQDWVWALVIAIACELPSRFDLPLSRHFASSVWRVVRDERVAISLRTVQRMLARHHLKPWRYASWMHPRDTKFVEKTRTILDLYAGFWEGRRLGRRDQIISADEKTSIQARQRRQVAPGPGQPGRVESDYKRRGALQYLCAWDVRRGIPWGRCEPQTGIDAFTRLVDQVMAMEPYRSAPRVFWIVDNGSSHQGAKSARRLRERYPNLILVHTPTHASWLNQIEVFFSIVQRKVLTPAVADSLAELEARILAFEAEYRRQPRPVRWKFTRQEFDRRLRELEQPTLPIAA